MTQLTARIDASGAEARMFRTVLASLPNSYRLTDGTADVVLTSGTEAETVAAACSNETRAVVVDLPGHLTPEDGHGDHRRRRYTRLRCGIPPLVSRHG